MIGISGGNGGARLKTRKLTAADFLHTGAINDELCTKGHSPLS